MVVNDPRVRELDLQIAMKEIERVAMIGVAEPSKRESDASKVQNAELDFDVARLHSEIGSVKRLRAEVTRLGHVVEEITATLTDTANVRDKVVERANNLSAQLAASVRRKNVYKSELTAVEEGLAKTRVERANLRCSVKDSVANCNCLLLTLVAHFRRLSRARIVRPGTLLTMPKQK